MSSMNPQSPPAFTDPRYQAVLEQLACDEGMSAENVMRAALRLYQAVRTRAGQGQHLAFTDEQGALVKEPVYGLPALD
jgi:hypothetical protein